jgi:hypothetical protein
MLAFLANLVMTPFAIVFSYAAVGTWLLCSAFTGFGIDVADKAPEISVTEELSMDEKIDEQVDGLLERENTDLREANEQWFNKYEELYAENKELKSEVRQVRMMLYTVACVSMIMLWSYGLVAYAYILATGLSKK